MKVRESGMPDEAVWASFFSPEKSLRALGLQAGMDGVVEFGCGYGTFTLPAASICRGTVHAFDIEPDMVELVRNRACSRDLQNIQVHHRDFVADGTGLPDANADYAMLFNILHAEHPEGLLAEAFRVLRPGGVLGIMHWRPSPDTPRGPPMHMRPTPAQCREWAEAVGFQAREPALDLPPHHFGVVVARP